MTGLPGYDLELKAAEDRRRLHSTITELRSRVKDTLDVQKQTRDHLALVCSVTALAGLVIGYSVTGIFVHR